MKKYLIRSLILSLLIAFLGTSKAKAQALEGQDEIIKKNVIKLLTTYKENCNFTSDEQSIDQNKILEFKKLFVTGDQAKLYNDIELGQVSGTTLSLDDYSVKLQLDYPRGVSIALEPEKAVISMAYRFAKHKIYIVDASVDKQLFGLYQSKQIQDFKGHLVFQITFSMANNVPSDFKILNVATSETKIDIVKEAKASKFLWGLEVMSIKSSLSTGYTDDANGWTLNPLSSVNFGLEMIIPLSPSFRFKTGLQYNSFETKLDYYKQDETNPKSFTDLDGDNYQVVTDANIVQINRLKSITIPLDAMVVLFPRKKFNIYLNGGVSFVKITNALNNVNGSLNRKGYYSQYNVTLENIPEYGFTNKSYNNEDQIWSLKSSAFFLDYGAGIILSLGKLSLKAGFYSTSSLGDLRGSEASYLDAIFGDTGSVMARASGFTVSILF